MDSIVVICSYKALPGKETAFLKLVQNHVPTLRSLGFLTEFPTSLLTSSDGSVIEIFEWKSKSVSEAAHENPKVKDVWGQMESLALATPLADLAEAKAPFAHFKKVPS